MKLLALLPFLVELIWDYILIARHHKADIIRLHHRVFMIIGASLLLMYFEPRLVKTITLACIPYCFFDPALNLLRGKRWDYNGSTKEWDIYIGKYNPRWILFGRSIVAYSLIIIYLYL